MPTLPWDGVLTVTVILSLIQKAMVITTGWLSCMKAKPISHLLLKTTEDWNVPNATIKIDNSLSYINTQ